MKKVTGRVDLSSAHVGDLVDDAASWGKCKSLALDGFTYDRISGDTAPKSFAARKGWLEKGAWFNGELFPQPYTQFARVMRAAGHEAEARKALMERDSIQFRVAREADQKALEAAYHGGVETKGDSGKIWLRLQARRVWAGLSRNIIGHGHKPQYALYWALGLWLAGTVVYFVAYKAGLMVPNSDVIMVSQEWLRAVGEDRLSPTGVWTGEGVLASVHYESFFAAIYALDLFLPIVDLGQESAWAVTTPTDFGWGWWLRVASFGYQVMGWLVTSLGIAAVTGFVQRDKPE